MRAFATYVLAGLIAVPLLAQTSAPKPIVLTAAVLRRAYHERLTPPAGASPWNWRLVSGVLPPGLTLEPDGVIAGMPAATGDYAFTLEATDSSTPLKTIREDFFIKVEPVLVIRWKASSAVANGGIFGSLEVVNHAGQGLDLTVIVVAVNEFNKAFALGYQHFTFGPGTQPIDFGSTLPRGAYVVHADAVAEIADSNTIYRARLQTSVLAVP